MLATKEFYFRGNLAFHLYLYKDMNGDNALLSTIPVVLIRKLFPSAMASVRFAHVPSLTASERLLDWLGQRILSSGKLKQFYYTSYLLDNGRIPSDTAEQVINFQEILHLHPYSYYSERNKPVQFFVLSQMYLTKKRHIERTAKRINSAYFEAEHMQSHRMDEEYCSLCQQELEYLELTEEEEVKYVLVLNKQKDLKMFVSY